VLHFPVRSTAGRGEVATFTPALVDAVSAILLISPDAAAHCRIAALHYENMEIPRGCAHAFAGLGELRQAEAAIDANAILHSGKASIDLDPGTGS